VSTLASASCPTPEVSPPISKGLDSWPSDPLNEVHWRYHWRVHGEMNRQLVQVLDDEALALIDALHHLDKMILLRRGGADRRKCGWRWDDLL